jgi:hypothetical protein
MMELKMKQEEDKYIEIVCIEKTIKFSVCQNATQKKLLTAAANDTLSPSLAKFADRWGKTLDTRYQKAIQELLDEDPFEAARRRTGRS